MARYVLKLPPLPQMGYYQDSAPSSRASHPFRTLQTRSASCGPAAPAGRALPTMGGGGCAGSGGSSEEGGAGCLEGLRGRRGPRGGRRGRRAAATPLGAGLSLQHDAIKFSAVHLARAEAVLADIVRDDLPAQGDVAPGVEAVCERLVQRLLCAVGAADPRFASKYLVCLDRRTSAESDGLTLEYLVRLDVLSTPALYPGEEPPCRVLEGAAQEAVPQGYARLQVHGQGLEQWAEFLSSTGFIRRDKVQERFVELLAAAAAPISSPPSRSSRPAHPPVGGVLLPAAVPTPAPRGPRGPHSPLQVDESRLCGAPGKVVDAAVLPDLLGQPADGQLFLASGTDRYPDPRDARIAIVEGSPWVRLRLGLTRDVLVKLVLGVGVDGWPRGSDLPARVPLTHPDCLLYQHIATTGCFLVASGPPPLLRCDDRPCTWQVWAPCGVATLLRHFGPRSAVSRSLRALEAVRRALALRAVSRHALRSLLLWRLERMDRPDGLDAMQDWLPASTPLHVIAMLDRLVCVLRGASERCYLFPALHLLSASARQGAVLAEDALLGDAAALAAFLRRLHVDCSTPGVAPRLHPASRRHSQESAQSWSSWPGEEEAGAKDCWILLEEALLPAWRTAIKDSAPPAATRSRRLGFRVSSSGPAAEAAHFTNRQLLYIGALLRGLLLCRAQRIEGPSTHSWFPGTMRRHPFAISSSSSSSGTLRCPSSAAFDMRAGGGKSGAWGAGAEVEAATADSEDVACLVAVVLEQARTYALARRGSDCSARADRGRSPSSSPRRPRRALSSSSAGSTGMTRPQRGRARADSVFRRRYNAAVDILLEAIRSDPGVVVPADDSALVGCVLRWLLASADRAPRALAAPLRRYLRALAQAAHGTAALHAQWAASRARARDELAAMAAFCRLVDAGRAQPMQGVLEAADKGWEWARWLLRLSGRLPGGVHAVLAPSPGRVLRFSLPADSLPSRWQRANEDFGPAADRSPSASSANTPHSTMTPSVARVYRAAIAAGTVSLAGVDEAWEPLHGRLRQSSPLSALLLQRHRQGLQRAIGDLLPALLALHKFSLVQEAAWTLPEPYRSEALDGVARIARETRRRSAARSRITPTSTLRRGAGRADRVGVHSELYHRVTDEDLDYGGETGDEPVDESLTEADRHLEQELRRMKVAESLLGTCRAARAPHHLGTELSKMFGDSAASSADAPDPVHPSLMSPPTTEGQYSFLEQTHDKELRLGPPPGPRPGARQARQGNPGPRPGPQGPPPAKVRSAAKKSDSHKKRDAITKL